MEVTGLPQNRKPINIRHHFELALKKVPIPICYPSKAITIFF